MQCEDLQWNEDHNKSVQVRRMPQEHSLENFVARFNQNLFFREFSFSRNKFSPTPASELELADHVVWLDDLLLIFQLKERNKNSTEARSHDTERKWFENKVLKHATKQVKDTQNYLTSMPQIHITNEKGHTFDIQTAKITTQINIILYDPDPLLPTNCRMLKHHISSTAGFMHLIAADDYTRVCELLTTPVEIGDYFSFRERLVRRHLECTVLNEDCLLGQFLAHAEEKTPHESFLKYTSDLRNNRDDWDFSVILNLFEERIIECEGTTKNALEYRRILQELANLNRLELFHVKLRLKLCIKGCEQSEPEIPYRATWHRTGCGFVFIPIPLNKSDVMLNALQNFTLAHKYDQKVDRCVGVAVASENRHQGSSTWLFAWCLIDEPWTYDLTMHDLLRDSFPFRDVHPDDTPIYQFD